MYKNQPNFAKSILEYNEKEGLNPNLNRKEYGRLGGICKRHPNKLSGCGQSIFKYRINDRI